VDAANGDFNLLPTSQCIDVGIDSLTITDAYGDTITVVDMDPSEYYNTAPDMGCYEYDPQTGIAQTGFENIKVYPNPTDGYVYFNIPEGQNANISITDISGKSVMKLNGVPGSGIDFSGLETGVYIIFIRTEKNIYTGKIVKK
jgi:hypothetical protein